MPGARTLRYANNTYHGRAQIWAPFFGNRLYSEARIYFDDPFTTLPVRVRLADSQNQPDPEALSSGLREAGFTHVMTNAANRQLSRPPEQRPAFLRTDFLDRFASLEYAEGGMPLYRLLPAEREPPTRQEAELLPNGGFERSRGAAPEGWEAGGTPQVDRSGQMARSGKVAIAVDGTSSYSSAQLPVEAGHTYRLRVYARTSQADAVGRLQLHFLSAEQEALGTDRLPFYPDADYRPFEMLDTAPAEAAYVRVTLSGTRARQWIWLDDVGLSEIAL